MSAHIFKLPDLGEGTVESEIGEWFIKVGEFVEEEAIVGTMMTDKAAVELASPVSGTVLKLAGEPGDIVAVGAALVTFETSAKGSDPVPASPAPELISDVTDDIEPLTENESKSDSDPKTKLKTTLTFKKDKTIFFNQMGNEYDWAIDQYFNNSESSFIEYNNILYEEVQKLAIVSRPTEIRCTGHDSCRRRWPHRADQSI